MDLNPRIANIFEKKTKNGSLVTENTAGTESTANIRSVNSMISKTKNNGVRDHLLFIFTKN